MFCDTEVFSRKVFVGGLPIDITETEIFIGGVPRPTKASELAFVLESQYGSVCYAGFDVDPDMKYPKGAARVTFNTFKSYVAAMAGRFVNIPHSYFWSMLYCLKQQRWALLLFRGGGGVD
ncbi:unnamed protein product [Meloidogyne enterolobii]|uniref:Uncharacterized protein n=1 Tax=Meloidogyne enterolobii TaxID=390850 RepID=A0ACB0XVC3_MELEN